jgi:LacI family transcriptional regulator
VTTLKDLSKHLGLSVTQISRALNDHSDVSKETKQRVLSAAKQLNYQPNMMARRLATGRSGIVGLIYPVVPGSMDSWFFTQFVAGLSTNFSRLDRQFMLHIAEDDPHDLDSYDKLISTRSIDGFVVVGPEVEDARVNFLRRKGIPFVLHGQTMDKPDYPFYDIDNLAIGRELTSHLARLGHRNIAFINGPEFASFAERRRQGYAQALQEADIAYRPDLHVSGVMTEDFGLLETVRLFQADKPAPTAIIASNMLLAKGVLRALAALRLRVPHDISLVAHDDVQSEPGRADPTEKLSTTEAALCDAWEPLARILDARLNGAALPELQQIGSHRFVDRGSVRPR